MVRQVMKLIFKAHAGRYIPLFPKDIDHLAPPANLWIATAVARIGDNIARQSEEYWRVRHSVAHELRQQFVCINNGKLAGTLRRFHIHTLRLQAGAKSLPVGSGWHEDDALTVGNRPSGKSADR